MIDGCGIRAGTRILIPVYALHRHRAHWQDPDAFDPDRFAPGAPAPDRHLYMPFGAGPRICLGAAFAMTELAVTLATLVRAARFRPCRHRSLSPAPASGRAAGCRCAWNSLSAAGFAHSAAARMRRNATARACMFVRIAQMPRLSPNCNKVAHARFHCRQGPHASPPPAGTPSPWGMFFRGFLKRPVMVGAVAPSSRFTINKMLAPVDWENTKLFVEYGPGVGTFTRPILDRLAPDGKLIVIDTNPDFIRYLKQSIADPRLIAVQGSAADVKQIIADHGFEHADYIASAPALLHAAAGRGRRDRQGHARSDPQGRRLSPSISTTRA